MLYAHHCESRVICSNFELAINSHHFWAVVECLRKDYAIATTQITQYARGLLHKKLYKKN